MLCARVVDGFQEEDSGFGAVESRAAFAFGTGLRRRRLEGLRPGRPTRDLPPSSSFIFSAPSLTSVLLFFIHSVILCPVLAHHHVLTRPLSTQRQTPSRPFRPIHAVSEGLRLNKHKYVSSPPSFLSSFPFFYSRHQPLNSFMILSWTSCVHPILTFVHACSSFGSVARDGGDVAHSLSSSSRPLAAVQLAVLRARVGYEQRILLISSICDEAGYGLIVRVPIRCLRQLLTWSVQAGGCLLEFVILNTLADGRQFPARARPSAAIRMRRGGTARVAAGGLGRLEYDGKRSMM
jgi:hypothetical protein